MKNQAGSIGIIGGTEGAVEVHIDEEKIKEIENIFAEYAPILKPNRKSVPEILEYIKSRYPAEEDNSPRLKKVVEMNVLGNFHKDKSDKEVSLKVTVLCIKNEGTGAALYNLQQQEHKEFITKMKQRVKNSKEYLYENIPIRIGAEEVYDYMFTEGSEALGDQITIFRGLDEKELQNKYLLANYVQTLKKYKIIK